MLVDYRKVNIYQDEELILKDVDWNIDEGQFVYVIGKVGSGKSSLVNDVLYPAVAERLEIKDKEIIKLSRLRYVQGSFDEGPIVLTTTCFPGTSTFLFKYDFEKDSLTKSLNENGQKRKYMEKVLTAVALNARESRLLGVAEGALAMRITSVSWNKKREIVETTESLYPLERNQFMLKLQL